MRFLYVSFSFRLLKFLKSFDNMKQDGLGFQTDRWTTGMLAKICTIRYTSRQMDE